MNAAERAHSLMIAHAVDLTAYANGVVRRMSALLTASDKQLWAELITAISDLSEEASFKVERLIMLLRSSQTINAATFSRITRELASEMEMLAAYEADFSAHAARAMLPPGTTVIAPNQVAAAVVEQPLMGRLMKEWASTLAESRMRKIQDAIALGFVQGRTIGELTRQIRGTRAANYADGLLTTSRREAETLARTAVGHYAAAAREQVWQQNADLVESVTWTSTLDSRTSEHCMIRDGLKYTPEGKPIGHRIPWLGGPGRIHWNCRSTSVPNLRGAEKLGLEPGPRASMDGPVKGTLTFAQWLKRQSAARQDEILGPTRGKLLRRGDYSLERFYNREGRFLTLSELRERDARTFEELGL